MPEDLTKFFYVSTKGFVTDDISRVQGECIAVVEATDQRQAEIIARNNGDLTDGKT